MERVTAFRLIEFKLTQVWGYRETTSPLASVKAHLSYGLKGDCKYLTLKKLWTI